MSYRNLQVLFWIIRLNLSKYSEIKFQNTCPKYCPPTRMYLILTDGGNNIEEEKKGFTLNLFYLVRRMLLSRPTRWGIIFIYIHELPRIWNMYNDLLRVDRLATAIFMLITLAYPKYCRCLFMSIVVHLLSSVWSIHNFSRRTSLSSQNPSKWRPVRCLIRLNDEREQGIDLTSKKKAQSNKLAKSLTKQNKKI